MEGCRCAALPLHHSRVVHDQLLWLGKASHAHGLTCTCFVSCPARRDEGNWALIVQSCTQVYLIIKDVCPGEDEVIIITSSLMKDMNSKTDLYRSNAIRVLCSICGQDTQLLVQIERYLKQAIVDKVSGLTRYEARTYCAEKNSNTNAVPVRSRKG